MKAKSLYFLWYKVKMQISIFFVHKMSGYVNEIYFPQNEGKW